MKDSTRKAVIPAEFSEVDYESPMVCLDQQDRLASHCVEAALYGDVHELSEREMRFADEYIRTNDVRKAAVALNPDLAKLSRGKQYARGKYWLGKKQIAAFITWRRTQIAMRTAVTDGELIENERLVFKQATGQVRVRESSIDTDTGEEQVRLHYSSNLPAANAATEVMRKVAGIGMDRNKPDSGPSIRGLTDREKLAELARLMRLAGVPVHEKEVIDIEEAEWTEQPKK